MNTSDLDEIVFQVLLSRMNGKNRRFMQPITDKMVLNLLEKTKEVFHSEPVLLRLDANISIVGDLHGNIDDLIRIFERIRYPPAMKYLFLGDYVDRGKYGTEILLLLFALKCKYPEHIYMLRGNHESMSLTRCYGFYSELASKYSDDVYDSIIDTFYELPLAAIIGEKIICVHGGISPDWRTLEELEAMEKPEEFSGPGVFTDLVWSDPDDEIEGFCPSTRGCGYMYGSDALLSFLDNNDLDLLVRSHEMCDEGIAWPYAEDENAVDRCLTIFSNSNYCGRENTGAILHVSSDLLVSVEVFNMLTLEEEQKRKILLPYWLSDLTASKEQAFHSRRRSRNENTANKITTNVKNDENSAAQDV